MLPIFLYTFDKILVMDGLFGETFPANPLIGVVQVPM